MSTPYIDQLHRKIRAGQQRECRLRKKLAAERDEHRREMDDEKDACLKFMKEAEERRIADINSIEDSRNKLLQNYLDEMKRRRNVMESAEKTLRTLRVWRLLGVAAILFWVVFWMGWPW